MHLMNSLFVILYLMCVCEISNSLSPYKPPYRIIFDNNKERSERNLITYHDDTQYLSLHCSNNHERMTDVFPHLNETLYFKGVHISGCSIYNTSYEREFKNLNINSSYAHTLNHRFDQDKPLPPGNYTEGLKIQHIATYGVNNHYFFRDVQNFFDPLIDLTSMYINNVEIPPLPIAMRLVNLTLTDDASIKNWGNCRYLERFELHSFNRDDFPVWPENCTRLKHLEIEYLKQPEKALMVSEKMVAAGPGLETLKITYCRLHSLPDTLIRSARKLIYLDLSENAFYDEVLMAFPYHNTLRTLDLSSNRIIGFGLGESILKLPSLVELRLKLQNGETESCEPGSRLFNDFIMPLQNSTIERLLLDYSNIQLDCIEDVILLNLKFLSMYVYMSDLKLLRLPKTDAGHLEVDFGYSRFNKILFDKVDYELLRTANLSSPDSWRNLTVSIKYINCDCEHGWLARALTDFPHMITMPDLRCGDDYGEQVLNEPKENIECDKIETDDCNYKRDWADGAVTAECKIEAWLNMEFMFPIQGLNVSGYNITTLHTTMPDNLQWVDLSHNEIAHGTASEAAALFAAGRRVWLADNLLLCNCDNRALLDAIQQHREQIQDFDLLKCFETDELLSSISTDVLCKVALISSLSAIGVLIVIAGVIAVMFRRYGEQLNMFLYSRGWCVFCLQKKDLNDKPYDAFISFAHEDREWVMGRLVPGLERAPERFRVCVHYRDWLVGDWIPAQIMRSVQLSKRTLIVLSRNFVVSPWSTMELKYSLANAEEDPSAKVLVLIKDDVLDMDLEMKLRAYLSNNTYLSCDDQWFWEKLRYAMPHRSKNNYQRTDDAEAGVEDMNTGDIKKDETTNLTASEIVSDTAMQGPENPIKNS